MNKFSFLLILLFAVFGSFRLIGQAKQSAQSTVTIVGLSKFGNYDFYYQKASYSRAAPRSMNLQDSAVISFAGEAMQKVKIWAINKSSKKVVPAFHLEVKENVVMKLVEVSDEEIKFEKQGK